MRDCDDLADDMRTTPQQYSNLKLFFSQSAQKTQRRETVIRIENIMAGEMAARLEQRFSDKPNALLTAEDEKRLLTESSTNVLIDSFDDSDVVSPTTEAQIYNMLKDMLISSRMVIIKLNLNDDGFIFELFKPFQTDNQGPERRNVGIGILERREL